MAAIDKVIETVRFLIQDTKQPYRYEDDVLKKFAQYTLNKMMFIRPDLFPVIAKIPVEPSSIIQKLPSNAFRLADVLAVCGAPCDDCGAPGGGGGSPPGGGGPPDDPGNCDLWTQQAYIKASNTKAHAQFGMSVALSADGNTLAVGADCENSAATGVNGNQTDNSAANAGAVYVFIRTGGSWAQQAYIKASNTNSNDRFGFAVALSADGNTLAVGAFGEDSSATGVNGDQTDNSINEAGAVYIFTRTGGSWAQQAYIKASNPGAYDHFGRNIALSADGNTLAVGALGEDSSATGVNGDQTNNSTFSSGAVYVFTRTGGSWVQQAYIKASNTGRNDWFGRSVALSADGNILAVGAPGEASAATGVNGDQTDNSASKSGAVYVFTRTGNLWTQQAYIKASNAEADDQFGNAVAFSADGNILAVAAFDEDSSATGVNGDQTNNSALHSGAVYVFTRTNDSWMQQAYIKASNTGSNFWFGHAIALSADGNTLAVSSPCETSASTGVNGDQTGSGFSNIGATYIFIRTGNLWIQQAYIKASNAKRNDWFGESVALSANGDTFVVGARGEDSAATGVNGDQTDNSASSSGAGYIFIRTCGS